MSFSDLGLAPELLRAIADQGYTEATPVQAQAMAPPGFCMGSVERTILIGPDIPWRSACIETRSDRKPLANCQRNDSAP